MENVIHDQLMTYLHDHNLLSKAQHGFLTRKSTGTNLLSCLHDWQFSLKNKRSIDIIYIDFKKAFDSLVHSKIIAKLSAYGIGYELLSWIQAFLTGRTQRVNIDNALSSYISRCVQWRGPGSRSCDLWFSYCLLRILSTVLPLMMLTQHHVASSLMTWNYILHIM